MKRCPKCNADYFDNMLEFCLEDGSRLTTMPATSTGTDKTYPIIPQMPDARAPIESNTSQETVVGLKSQAAVGRAAPAVEASDKTAQILAYSPLIIALVHNWWQWVYLEKVYVYSITEYLLSANFLMWALLLIAGAVLGVYSLKRSGNRTVAIITLVTLAINFILYLAPRR